MVFSPGDSQERDYLVKCNTLFNQKERRRATWISPDGTTKNQIYYIIIERKNKKVVKESRVYNSRDIGSDHTLVKATME